MAREHRGESREGSLDVSLPFARKRVRRCCEPGHKPPDLLRWLTQALKVYEQGSHIWLRGCTGTLRGHLCKLKDVGVCTRARRSSMGDLSSDWTTQEESSNVALGIKQKNPVRYAFLRLTDIIAFFSFVIVVTPVLSRSFRLS